MKVYIKSSIKDVSEESPFDRNRVAVDITADPRTLQQLAESDPEPLIRENAKYTLDGIEWGKDFLTRTGADPEILDELACSSGSTVRYYIARHPNTSEITLRRLANDTIDAVRQAARETLRSQGL